MDSDAKNQLKSILGTYDAKLAEQERLEAVKRAADAAFPVRFATLKAETIRPAIQEFVDVLSAHGHEATAREQEESSSAAGGVSYAAISLRVIPKPFAHRSTDAPKTFIEITFSANRSGRKIIVSSTSTLMSAGGSVGKRGEYEIEAMTGKVIAEHVLQALQEALR
jgi:hypothetical protein